MIDEALANTPVDTPMTLVIDGVSAELTGFVSRKDERATLVKFELSEAANKIVNELISVRKAA